MRLDAGFDGTKLRDQLLARHGCFVRNCANKLGSTPQHFRIAARPQPEVDALVTALRAELAADRPEA